MAYTTVWGFSIWEERFQRQFFFQLSFWISALLNFNSELVCLVLLPQLWNSPRIGSILLIIEQRTSQNLFCERTAFYWGTNNSLESVESSYIDFGQFFRKKLLCLLPYSFTQLLIEILIFYAMCSWRLKGMEKWIDLLTQKTSNLMCSFSRIKETKLSTKKHRVNKDGICLSWFRLKLKELQRLKLTKNFIFLIKYKNKITVPKYTRIYFYFFFALIIYIDQSSFFPTEVNVCLFK